MVAVAGPRIWRVLARGVPFRRPLPSWVNQRAHRGSRSRLLPGLSATKYSQDRILGDGSFVPGSINTSAQHFSGLLNRAEQGVIDTPASLESVAEGSLPSFVPPAAPITAHDLEALEQFVAAHPNCLVITGAGVSTESHIPDYRSPGGAYSTGFKPMTHQEFMRSAKARARYWARSFAGWYRYGAVVPNVAHAALAALQNRRWVGPIVTQNVDGLHQRAGARDVLELHGATRRVRCVRCGDVRDRDGVQRELAELNPEADRLARAMAGGESSMCGKRDNRPKNEGGEFTIPVRRPDGDVELQDAGQGFIVPPCRVCGGPLKPDVVFFGDSVPPAVAHRAAAAAAVAPAVLAVGTSLQVWSAFRLVRSAKNNGAPLALLSIGPSRADELADLKIEARAGEALPRLSHAAHFRKLRSS